jgi:hypothetical protein
MAGKLIANTINTDTGIYSTNNAFSGLPKAWVNFDGGFTNTPGTIYGSLNVSSVTYTATGIYNIAFTTAMANTNYAFLGSAEYYTNNTALMCVTANARSLYSISVNVDYVNSTSFNTDRVNTVIFNT